MSFKAPRIFGYKKTDVMICGYCGEYTIKTHHRQKYCPEPKKCRYFARLEKKSVYNKTYNSKKKRELEKGTSNIREHRNPDFIKESQIVRNEVNIVLKRG